MEKNPCYEETSVYENIEQCDSSTEVKVVNSDTQDETAAKARARKIKRCLMVTAVVVIISLLVLLLVVAIVLAGYSHVDIIGLQEQVDDSQDQITNNLMNQLTQLEIRIVQLEHQLNQTKQQSQWQFDKLEETQQALNDSLKYSVDSLQHQLNQTKQQSQEQLYKLEETQQALNDSLEYSMGSLEHQLNQTKQQSQEQFDKLEESLQATSDSLELLGLNNTSELKSLQCSVETLTTRVNSPVNLYQNCTQQTRSCAMIRVRDSWRGCATSSVPLNVDGYYTTDVRCQYNVNIDHLESSVLWSNGDAVWCHCDVTLPTLNGHATLSTQTSGTCTLVVTRCPTTLYWP